LPWLLDYKQRRAHDTSTEAPLAPYPVDHSRIGWVIAPAPLTEQAR
jgi:hypothetical protein